MEKIYKINKSKNGYFTSFIAKRDVTSKHIFRGNVKETSTMCFSILAKFTDGYCNYKQQLSQVSSKMGFTIEDKVLILIIINN
jgi:hypothetical protein